jgi:mannose PTS system EIIA component
MIALVLVSHGEMCKYLLRSAELIVGPQSNVATIDLLAEDSPESYRERLSSAMGTLDMGEGVLVLVDLCGGTPCNVTGAMLQERADLYAVTGANLPMMLEVCMNRDSGLSLTELGELAANSGKDGVIDLVKMMGCPL